MIPGVSISERVHCQLQLSRDQQHSGKAEYFSTTFQLIVLSGLHTFTSLSFIQLNFSKKELHISLDDGMGCHACATYNTLDNIPGNLHVIV